VPAIHATPIPSIELIARPIARHFEASGVEQFTSAQR
jgi:hypothetical protein